MNSRGEVQRLDDSKNMRFGVVLSYGGMAISVIGALLVSNKVLNYIGDYSYGLYSFVNSITTWLTVVSNALSASFLRYTTIESIKNNGDVGKINSIYLKMLSVIGCGVWLLGFSILGALFFSHHNIGKYNTEDSLLMYKLFALSIFNIGLTMPLSFFSLYVNYKKRFIFSKLLSITVSIVTFAGQFFIAYYTRSILLLSGFSIAITLFTFFSNAIFSKKCLGIKFAKVSLIENKKLIRAIFLFSSILLFNSIVDQINSNVDKMLLGIFARPEDVTIYQMAQQLATCFAIMSVSVSGVFAPLIHEYVATNESLKINNLYLKISKIQSLILCCVAFGFLSCGQNFVLWWIGESRVSSYYVAATLMILSIGPLTMNSSIEIQRAQNKHLFRAIVYFALAISNVLLSCLFLKIFPADKAVFACLTGTVITTICSHWVMMNIYNKRVIGLPIGKYLINLLQCIIFGFMGFAVVICFSKFISQRESVFVRFILQGTVFVTVYMILAYSSNRRIVNNYIRYKILHKD